MLGDITRRISQHIVIPGMRRSSRCAAVESVGSDEPEANSTEPLEGARIGLERVRNGISILANLEIPHGAQAFEKLCTAVEELQARVDEDAAYRRRWPESSPLREVQVCFAAGGEDPPEWSMGKLLLSAHGLLFEATGQPPWCIGPLEWDDIACMEKIRLRDTGAKYGDTIRLALRDGVTSFLLAGIQNLDLLQEFGRLGDDSPRAPLWGESCTSHVEAVMAEEVPPAPLDDAVFRPSCTTSPSQSWVDHYSSFSSDSRALHPPAHPTDSFLSAADSLPADVPQNSSQTFRAELKDTTLDDIYRWLRSDTDWPIRSFLEEALLITEVEEAPWVSSQRIPGTVTRRLRFRMPVPADIPSAVKRLVSLPKTSMCTHLSRLGRSADRIVLVQEVCTHDITYGDHFWAQDILAFCSDGAGGALFEKFTSVRWVTALPWYAGVLETFIDMKAKADAKTTGAMLVTYIEKNGRRFHVGGA